MSVFRECSVLSGKRSLRRTDHSSREVLPSVVFLSVIEDPHRGGLGPLGLSSHVKKKMSLATLRQRNWHERRKIQPTVF